MEKAAHQKKKKKKKKKQNWFETYKYKTPKKAASVLTRVLHSMKCYKSAVYAK